MNTSGNTPHSRAETVPDLLSMSPALADRAWRRWLADGEPFEGDLGGLAHNVGLAINEWRMEAGRDGEAIARKNLVERLATFWAAYKAND